MPTIHARVADARERLRAAGIPPNEADLDARLLAEHVLGWDAAQYFTAAEQAEPEGFAGRYEPLVARRERREPVAYISGHREFWTLDFEVSPAVLIPRPETELIVEVALELFPDGPPLSVGDVCTGSGCLAVALAVARPQAQVIATDVSDAALEVARHNARRHGVDARVRFAYADLLDGIDGPFDLIVSNPPYVPDRDRSTLPPEVRDYEPAVALFAGPDGLAVVRSLLDAVPRRLTPGGVFVFEFGFGQADAIPALISATPGLTMVGLRRDLRGIPRTAIAKRE